MRRVLLASLIALGFAPGIVWRSAPSAPDDSQMMEAVPLSLPFGPLSVGAKGPASDAARIGGAGGPLLTGAWQLTSPNTAFESWSALLALDGGQTLLAISDRGQYARFPAPVLAGGPAAAIIGPVLPGSDDFKPLQDMESATRDPASGRTWLGLEGRNAILRMESDLSDPQFAYPEAMKDWVSNSGPESLTRLADGRFLVLSEGPAPRREDASEGLLFSGDPLDGGEPERFYFRPPAGLLPTDMAQLPDGRVLILLRGIKFGAPPRFVTRLVLADPATIRADEDWAWSDVGELGVDMPYENYEGLAITGGADGGPVTLWLLSDDNGATFIQRTLLLRFEWSPGQP